MIRHNFLRFIITSLLCSLISLLLVGCNRSDKSHDDNPLPQYIEQYRHETNHVMLHTCRMLNRRTRSYYRGVGQTEKEAKAMAMKSCKMASRFEGSCHEYIKFECGRRSQLAN